MIEIHRLLKNSITDATGVRAYTAYTAAAVDALGLDGFTDNLTPHTETYPDLGTLSTWVQDMHPVWEDQRDDSRVRVDPADALARVQDQLPVPVGVAWELLLQPEYRSILFGVDRQDPSRRQHGRIAEGTVFTCYHGANLVTTQTVLALQPLQRIVTEDTTPIPGARIVGEIALEPRGDSTAITVTCSRGRGPWLSRSVNNFLGGRMMGPRLRGGLAALRERIEGDIAEGRLQFPEPNEGLATGVDPTAGGEPATGNGDQ